MITASEIRYTIKDDKLGVVTETTDKSIAEEVEQNLKKTREFIDTLEKYFTLPSESNYHVSCDSSYEYTYSVSESGILNGLCKHISRTEHDTWGSHPSISNSWTEKISVEKFKERYLEHVFIYLLSWIKVLSSIKISELGKLYNYRIDDEIKTKLETYKKDLEILRNYKFESFKFSLK